MIQLFKRNKLLTIMLIMSFISFLFGFFLNLFLDDSYKKIIGDNIELLVNNKLIIPRNIIVNNIALVFSIWCLGISIIGILVIIPLYLFKVFVFAFEANSLFVILGFKNILLIVVYLLPELINIFIYFIISYYASYFSFYLIKHLFYNSNYNMRKITRRFLYVLLLSLLLIIISSVLEMFILPNLKSLQV